MKVTLRALVQKTALISAAFILAVSSLTALGPFVLSQNVGAVPVYSPDESVATVSNETDFRDALTKATVHTINLDGSFSTSSEIVISKNLTVNGNGNTITSAFSFSNANSANNSVIEVTGTANTVTFNNLTVAGVKSADLHALNVYVSNVVLNNVTVNNHGRNAVNINGSTATVAEGGFYTSGNGRITYGVVELGQGVGVTRVPNYVVNGPVNHTEGIFVSHIRRTSTSVVSGTQYDDYYTSSYRLKQAPGNPVIVTPATNGVELNNADVTVEWNPVALTSSRQAAAKYNYEIVGGVAGTTTGTSALLNLVDGSYTLRVQAVSATGLASGWSTRTLTVSIPVPDTSRPQLSNVQISPIVNGNTGGLVTVQFDLVDATGVDLTKTRVLFADGPNTSNAKRESAKYTPVLVSGNTYKVEIDTLEFVKANWTGRYSLTFNLWDTLGNQGSSKPVTNLLIDNSGPTSTLKTPVSGSLVGGTVRFTFEVADDTGVASGYMKFQDASTQYALSQGTGNEWYVDINTNALTEGSHVIDARFVDSLGKARYGANKGSVVVDNEVPTTSIISASVLGDTINFQGSVNDANLNYYYCYLTTNQTIVVDGHTFTPGQEVKLNNNADSSRNGACNTTWAHGATNFTGTLGGFNITGVPDGSYTINLVARDLVGNNNASSPATYVLTIDRTAPEAPVINDANANGASGTAEPGSRVLVRVGSEEFEDFADEDGNWAVAFVPALATGNRILNVTATDDAGNTSAELTRIVVVPAVIVVPNVVEQITTPATAAPAFVAFAPPSAIGPTDVLGDADENTDADDADVAGSAAERTLAQAASSDANQGKLWGIDWYWWLLILAGIATIVWWAVAAVSRRNED